MVLQAQQARAACPRPCGSSRRRTPRRRPPRRRSPSGRSRRARRGAGGTAGRAGRAAARRVCGAANIAARGHAGEPSRDRAAGGKKDLGHPAEAAQREQPGGQPTSSQARTTPSTRLARRPEARVSQAGSSRPPAFSMIYWRISLRTTCEGVTSCAAHNSSKIFFLRGSTRMVRRAVRLSIGSLYVNGIIISL